jgi:hypothetical protein
VRSARPACASFEKPRAASENAPTARQVVALEHESDTGTPLELAKLDVLQLAPSSLVSRNSTGSRLAWEGDTVHGSWSFAPMAVVVSASPMHVEGVGQLRLVTAPVPDGSVTELQDAPPSVVVSMTAVASVVV